jgi:hypothetical protein
MIPCGHRLKATLNTLCCDPLSSPFEVQTIRKLTFGYFLAYCWSRSCKRDAYIDGCCVVESNLIDKSAWIVQVSTSLQMLPPPRPRYSTRSSPTHPHRHWNQSIQDRSHPHDHSRPPWSRRTPSHCFHWKWTQAPSLYRPATAPATPSTRNSPL